MAALSTSFQTSSKQYWSTLLYARSKKNQLICVVCGSIARGYNFGAITCMSCKTFFRRNALINLNNFHCNQEGNCEIKQETRKYCTYCRLLTCFRVGMKRELFRSRENIEKQQYNKQGIVAPYLSETASSYQLLSIADPLLIRSLDLSHLSNNDWFLLRQLSSTFDSLTDHVISKTNEIHHQLLLIGIQPLKVRAKAQYIYDMTNIFADAVLAFVKYIPQFILLPPINKHALLMRNTRPMIMFHSHYLFNLKSAQILTQTPYWISSIETLLSPSTRHLYNEITSHVGHVSFSDPCLIKLILVILAFSTNNIDHNEMIFTSQLDEYTHTYVLHKIQNIYVELMWKYMIHQFGESHTILHFFAIIKTILLIQNVIFTMDHSTMLFEQKFYKNVIKSITKSVEFNINI